MAPTTRLRKLNLVPCYIPKKLRYPKTGWGKSVRLNTSHFPPPKKTKKTHNHQRDATLSGCTSVHFGVTPYRDKNSENSNKTRTVFPLETQSQLTNAQRGLRCREELVTQFLLLLFSYPERERVRKNNAVRRADLSRYLHCNPVSMQSRFLCQCCNGESPQRQSVRYCAGGCGRYRNRGTLPLAYCQGRKEKNCDTL
ncbi:uncharacterized protein KNAG_0C06560 [Huiozyma naganishii CBS 8797]|uniref:Uncharacterized protein n=1 Tax=Huiozyma naganishii (strain ATCC MYA-139 / BCRC 22969 / CBS 8797 / KCTC 17520 / NBRC 10181 / NCYC 3082 / Yp74L-3) TaxID=1071383 RepID=J7S5A3_HUIN7|nr:hypothetical protein KNAG_0C06560 [Kazachstania naganishii CBS 8797]CCK69749.1 hypothetical protein KNAG_0C06560 [Kazachstania naganishii CBS 8797]